MNKKYLLILLAFCLVFLSGELSAQVKFKGSNLLEYQLGNIPNLDPEYQSSLYDQLDLSLKYKLFSVQTKIENYIPAFDADLGYRKINQYLAQYKSKDLSVSVGNIYTMLGKGLLLRTYEIPGSIWEDRGYRVRYGFYKDLEGAEIKYKLGRFRIQAVYGNVLNVALPPILDNKERRPDFVQGSELSYKHKKHSLGLIYMNHRNADINNHYTSIYGSTGLFKNISVHGELALQTGSGNKYEIKNDSTYAAYFSINYTKGKLGLSLELKDYKNFSLGSGITDPPTLVKEHSYRLLNRSTHIPVLTDERGYQLDLFYRFSNGSLLSINNSYTQNKISADNSPIFKEVFAEYQFTLGKQVVTHFFADYSSDPIKNEKNRYTSGLSLDIRHSKLSSLFEIQTQFINREGADTTHFRNMFFAYSLNIGSKISATALAELSNDPFLFTDDEKNIWYPGINFTYKPNFKNTIQVFYGKRRGGPACNSGVCYDVLDFEGFEIRITSHF